jgi:hypothetical protein
MAANASILDGKGLATPRGRSGVGRPRDSAPPLIAINHSQRLVAHRAGFAPTVIPVIFFNARSKSITARAVPTGAALVTEATGEKETSAVPEFAVRMQVASSILLNHLQNIQLYVTDLSSRHLVVVHLLLSLLVLTTDESSACRHFRGNM